MTFTICSFLISCTTLPENYFKTSLLYFIIKKKVNIDMFMSWENYVIKLCWS